jgi:hypothetical protein
VFQLERIMHHQIMQACACFRFFFLLQKRVAYKEKDRQAKLLLFGEAKDGAGELRMKDVLCFGHPFDIMYFFVLKLLLPLATTIDTVQYRYNTVHQNASLLKLHTSRNEPIKDRPRRRR